MIDAIRKQAIRITDRFYKNLGITDKSQWDGLMMDIESTITKFATTGEHLTTNKQRSSKMKPMEELQQVLITEIGKQLEVEKKNIQLLDVLNRLLGTVNNCLIANNNKQ